MSLLLYSQKLITFWRQSKNAIIKSIPLCEWEKIVESTHTLITSAPTGLRHYLDANSKSHHHHQNSAPLQFRTTHRRTHNQHKTKFYTTHTHTQYTSESANIKII